MSSGDRPSRDAIDRKLRCARGTMALNTAGSILVKNAICLFLGLAAAKILHGKEPSFARNRFHRRR
jgi:hypothetical protein